MAANTKQQRVLAASSDGGAASSSSDPTRTSERAEDTNGRQADDKEVGDKRKRPESMMEGTGRPEQTDKRQCSDRGRPARGCAQRIDYSEIKRRGPRKRKVEHSTAYMDASGATGGRVALSKAIAV